MSLHKKGTADPRLETERLAKAHGFQKITIQTDPFLLTTYQKFQPNQKSNQKLDEVSIYIEGDGRSWISRHQLSNDPTPRQPLALKLAFQDPSPAVVYLARPCQYTPIATEPACEARIWSDLRFSERVVASMNEAITTLKNTAQATKIHLIGFSGGGAIAILIADRRNDIATLRTVAGDLDPARLSEYHHTTPLTGSLNPSDAIPRLLDLPQYHFSGEKDTVVPPFIAETFVLRLNQQGSHCAKYKIIPKATHHEGFEPIWSTLLQLPVTCM
jgi:pimeloyl-ACP methyl ester carboxylesterase